jgi:ATP-dependent protease HslVU (ClpYQ) peptidase subunit
VTVVAAIARDGEIVMAADTATSYCGTYVDGAVKIRQVTFGAETALLAAAGNGALLAVAQRALADTVAPSDGDTQDWLDQLATTISTAAAEHNPPLLEDNRIDGALLLGWRGQLHYLFTHQATRVADGVAGLGAGCDVALGAMHAALIDGVTIEQAARLAVTLACRFAEGCAVGPDGPTVLTQET